MGWHVLNHLKTGGTLHVGEVAGDACDLPCLGEVQAAHAEDWMPTASYCGRMGKFVFSPAERKSQIRQDILQWEDYN